MDPLDLRLRAQYAPPSPGRRNHPGWVEFELYTISEGWVPVLNLPAAFSPSTGGRAAQERVITETVSEFLSQLRGLAETSERLIDLADGSAT